MDFWRSPASRLCEFGNLIGQPLEESAALHFEYAVPVQSGRGKASFTDLMILTGNTAVAVEAKYTEPEYQNVGKWLGGESVGNRADVLKGWLDLINATTEASLTPESVSVLPYQVIHTSASACYPRKAHAALVYLVFHADVPDHYATHLSAFAALLPDHTRFSLHLVSCAIKGSEAYGAHTSRWDAGERTLGEDVRDALAAGPLFEFSNLSARRF